MSNYRIYGAEDIALPARDLPDHVGVRRVSLLPSGAVETSSLFVRDSPRFTLNDRGLDSRPNDRKATPV